MMNNQLHYLITIANLQSFKSFTKSLGHCKRVKQTLFIIIIYIKSFVESFEVLRAGHTRSLAWHFNKSFSPFTSRLNMGVIIQLVVTGSFDEMCIVSSLIYSKQSCFFHRQRRQT